MSDQHSSLVRIGVVLTFRLGFVFVLNMWLIAQYKLMDGQVALPIGTFTVCSDTFGAYFGYLPPQPSIGVYPEFRFVDYSSTQALVRVQSSLESRHRSILQLPGLRVWRSILPRAFYDRIVFYLGFPVVLIAIIVADFAVHRRLPKWPAKRGPCLAIKAG